MLVHNTPRPLVGPVGSLGTLVPGTPALP